MGWSGRAPAEERVGWCHYRCPREAPESNVNLLLAIRFTHLRPIPWALNAHSEPCELVNLLPSRSAECARRAFAPKKKNDVVLKFYLITSQGSQGSQRSKEALQAGIMRVNLRPRG